MVTGRRLRRRAGKAPVKFLLTLAILAVVVFYGTGVVRSYVRYYRMKDEMRAQARVAASLTDDDIRRRLRTRATELQLPGPAQRVAIRRQARPREIVLTVSWPDTIVLPFYRWARTRRLEIRAPL